MSIESAVSGLAEGAGGRDAHRSHTRVSMCDGCCCGTTRKHPGVDHAGIRNLLAAAVASTGGRSRSVACLGVCERSNVVLVRTRQAGSFWIGEVLDEPIVVALDGWIRQGTPLPVPAEVAAHVFDRDAPMRASTGPLPELVSFTQGPQR